MFTTHSVTMFLRNGGEHLGCAKGNVLAAIRRKLIAFCLVCVTGFVCPRSAIAIEFEQIESAWKARTKQAQTVEIQWSEQRLSHLTDENGSNGRELLRHIPDMKFFASSGSKVRFEDVLAGETPDTAGRTIDAYNGAEFRILFYADQEPQGAISTDVRPSFAGTLMAWPPLLLYRGSDPELINCALSDFRDGKLVEEANGDVVLHAVDKRQQDNSKVWSLKLRPELDFAPIRLTGAVNGVPYVDLEIDVERGEDSIIRPTSWKILLTQSGNVLFSNTATVVSCKTNGHLDDSLFDLVFPIRSIVRDHRPRQNGGKSRLYLVTENGEREVLRSELLKGMTRDELMQNQDAVQR